MDNIIIAFFEKITEEIDIVSDTDEEIDTEEVEENLDNTLKKYINEDIQLYFVFPTFIYAKKQGTKNVPCFLQNSFAFFAVFSRPAYKVINSAFVTSKAPSFFTISRIP